MLPANAIYLAQHLIVEQSHGGYPGAGGRRECSRRYQRGRDGGAGAGGCGVAGAEICGRARVADRLAGKVRRIRARRRKRSKKAQRAFNIVVSVLIVAVVVTAVFAFANAISGVNSPNVGENESGINVAALQPAECRAAGLAPTTIVEGNTGTGGSDLILGTNAVNTIRGQGGNDCLVGGAGNDSLRGGAGNNDVCIGGPGSNDTFTGCEHQYQ